MKKGVKKSNHRSSKQAKLSQSKQNARSQSSVLLQQNTVNKMQTDSSQAKPMQRYGALLFIGLIVVLLLLFFVNDIFQSSQNGKESFFGKAIDFFSSKKDISTENTNTFLTYLHDNKYVDDVQLADLQSSSQQLKKFSDRTDANDLFKSVLQELNQNYLSADESKDFAGQAVRGQKKKNGKYGRKEGALTGDSTVDDSKYLFTKAWVEKNANNQYVLNLLVNQEKKKEVNLNLNVLITLTLVGYDKTPNITGVQEDTTQFSINFKQVPPNGGYKIIDNGADEIVQIYLNGVNNLFKCDNNPNKFICQERVLEVKYLALSITSTKLSEILQPLNKENCFHFEVSNPNYKVDSCNLVNNACTATSCPSGEVCMKNGVCAQNLNFNCGDSHICSFLGYYCQQSNNVCVLGCDANDDCVNPTPFCDVSQHVCIAINPQSDKKCTVNSCDSGKVCDAVKGCIADDALLSDSCKVETDCNVLGYYCSSENSCIKGCDYNNDCLAGEKCNANTNSCIEDKSASCTETDTGKDTLKKGKTFENGMLAGEDSCEDNSVREYFCLNDGSGLSDNDDIPCGANEVCKDGACVAKEIVVQQQSFQASVDLITKKLNVIGNLYFSVILDNEQNSAKGFSLFPVSLSLSELNTVKFCGDKLCDDSEIIIHADSNNDDINENYTLNKDNCFSYDSSKTVEENKKASCDLIGKNDDIQTMCTDTDTIANNDDGTAQTMKKYVNYAVVGTVVGANKDTNVIETKTDSCANDHKKLIEYFCNVAGNYYDSVQVTATVGQACDKGLFVKADGTQDTFCDDINFKCNDGLTCNQNKCVAKPKTLDKTCITPEAGKPLTISDNKPICVGTYVIPSITFTADSQQLICQPGVIFNSPQQKTTLITIDSKVNIKIEGCTFQNFDTVIDVKGSSTDISIIRNKFNNDSNSIVSDAGFSGNNVIQANVFNSADNTVAIKVKPTVQFKGNLYLDYNSFVNSFVGFQDFDVVILNNNGFLGEKQTDVGVGFFAKNNNQIIVKANTVVTKNNYPTFKFYDTKIALLLSGNFIDSKLHLDLGNNKKVSLLNNQFKKAENSPLDITNSDLVFMYGNGYMRSTLTTLVAFSFQDIKNSVVINNRFHLNEPDFKNNYADYQFTVADSPQNYFVGIDLKKVNVDSKTPSNVHFYYPINVQVKNKDNALLDFAQLNILDHQNEKVFSAPIIDGYPFGDVNAYKNFPIYFYSKTDKGILAPENDPTINTVQVTYGDEKDKAKQSVIKQKITDTKQANLIVNVQSTLSCFSPLSSFTQKYEFLKSSSPIVYTTIIKEKTLEVNAVVSYNKENAVDQLQTNQCSGAAGSQDISCEKASDCISPLACNFIIKKCEVVDVNKLAPYFVPNDCTGAADCAYSNYYCNFAALDKKSNNWGKCEKGCDENNDCISNKCTIATHTCDNSQSVIDFDYSLAQNDDPLFVDLILTSKQEGKSYNWITTKKNGESNSGTVSNKEYTLTYLKSAIGDVFPLKVKLKLTNSQNKVLESTEKTIDFQCLDNDNCVSKCPLQSSITDKQMLCISQVLLPLKTTAPDVFSAIGNDCTIQKMKDGNPLLVTCTDAEVYLESYNNCVVDKIIDQEIKTKLSNCLIANICVDSNPDNNKFKSGVVIDKADKKWSDSCVDGKSVGYSCDVDGNAKILTEQSCPDVCWPEGAAVETLTYCKTVGDVKTDTKECKTDADCTDVINGMCDLVTLKCASHLANFDYDLSKSTDATKVSITATATEKGTDSQGAGVTYKWEYQVKDATDWKNDLIIDSKTLFSAKGDILKTDFPLNLKLTIIKGTVTDSITKKIEVPGCFENKDCTSPKVCDTQNNVCVQTSCTDSDTKDSNDDSTAQTMKKYVNYAVVGTVVGTNKDTNTQETKTDSCTDDHTKLIEYFCNVVNNKDGNYYDSLQVTATVGQACDKGLFVKADGSKDTFCDATNFKCNAELVCTQNKCVEKTNIPDIKNTCDTDSDCGTDGIKFCNTNKKCEVNNEPSGFVYYDHTTDSVVFYISDNAGIKTVKLEPSDPSVLQTEINQYTIDCKSEINCKLDDQTKTMYAAEEAWAMCSKEGCNSTVTLTVTVIDGKDKKSVIVLNPENDYYYKSINWSLKTSETKPDSINSCDCEQAKPVKSTDTGNNPSQTGGDTGGHSGNKAPCTPEYNDKICTDGLKAASCVSGERKYSCPDVNDCGEPKIVTEVCSTISDPEVVGHCFNKKFDGNENAVDCGGDCKQCPITISSSTVKESSIASTPVEQPPVEDQSVQETPANEIPTETTSDTATSDTSLTLMKYLLYGIPILLVVLLLLFLLFRRKSSPHLEQEAGLNNNLNNNLNSPNNLQQQPQQQRFVSQFNVNTEAQLKKYITAQLEAGLGRETITQTLVNAGWHHDQIDTVFEQQTHQVLPAQYQEQLKKYVDFYLDKGMTKEEIRAKLLAGGWHENVVNQYL